MRVLILLLIATISVSASQLRMTLLHLPVYFHSDTDPELSKVSVPFVTSSARPEALLGAMMQPYIPHQDGSWNSSTDINLVTVYKFSLSFAPIEGTKNYSFVIDSSAAKKPDTYPFSVQEVTEMIKLCAKANYIGNEDSEIIVTVLNQEPKQGEQAVPPKSDRADG